MSEHTNMRAVRTKIRRRLLSTVSALALIGSACGAMAADSDGDRPLVWIEIGGQFDRLDDQQQTFSPPFMPAITEPHQLTALDVQRPMPNALDKDATISFQPEGSDWVFSAGIRYGRSAAKRHTHQQTPNAYVHVLPLTFYGFKSLNGFAFGNYYAYPSKHVKFADGQSQQSESHTILDFLVGKDVGIGTLGTAVVSGGVRVGQFVSKSNVGLNAMPDLQYPSAPIADHAQKYQFLHDKIHFHDYQASAAEKRNFRGIGPEIAWKASTPVAGNDTGNGEIALDWGANISLLFGRQKASGHHQTVINSYYLTRAEGGGNNFPGQAFGTPAHRVHPVYFYGPCSNPGFFHRSLAICSQHVNAATHNRSRMVTVPNLGGFAGISFTYRDAKVSFGYRADEFFGAMDGGIDTAKKENRGLFGPYASISIGLGG